MLKSAVSECQINGTFPRYNNNNRMSRRKSLPRNIFRGVKKDVLQQETNLFIASMTVS